MKLKIFQKYKIKRHLLGVNKIINWLQLIIVNLSKITGMWQSAAFNYGMCHQLVMYDKI